MLSAQDDRGTTDRSTELACPRNTTVGPTPRRSLLDCQWVSRRPVLGQDRNLRRTRRWVTYRRRCWLMFRVTRRGGPVPKKRYLLHCRYRDRLRGHCLSRSDGSAVALRRVLASLGPATA